MGDGPAAVFLDFKHLGDQLLGDQIVAVPASSQPTNAPDGRPYVWVSFDAIKESTEFEPVANGLAYIRKRPVERIGAPLAIGRNPKPDLYFDYSHEFYVDRILAVVAFPSGCTADHFEPWPRDAKQTVDGRLAVYYDVATPDGLQLQWQLAKLSLEERISEEAARIKARLTRDKTLILFVHGLGGHETKTWGDFEDYLLRDSTWAKQYDIAFFSYPTALLRLIPFFSKFTPRIQELAAALATQIDNRYREYDDIVLVTHSLGGLVARQYLIGEQQANRSHRVSGLMLFGVPNNGADLARLARFISIRHWQLKQLCRNSDFLDFLNTSWAAMNLEKTVPTKYVAGMQDGVVDRVSAQGAWGNRVETVNKTHRGLVKPTRADDDVVLILKRFLEEIKKHQKTDEGVNAARTPKPQGFEQMPQPTGADMAILRDLADQLRIQNQPVFEAKVEIIVHDGIAKHDRIVLRNIGASISQVNVQIASYFKVRFYDFASPMKFSFVQIFGYYPAVSATGNGVGDLFLTVPTQHRLRAQRLSLLAMNTPIRGFKAFVDLEHFLRVSYQDRSRRAITEYIDVRFDGFRQIVEDEWNHIMGLAESRDRFDFDAMTDQQFISILSEHLAAA